VRLASTKRVFEEVIELRFTKNNLRFRVIVAILNVDRPITARPAPPTQKSI